AASALCGFFQRNLSGSVAVSFWGRIFWRTEPMKKFVAISLVAWMVGRVVAAPSELREQLNFNAGWKFQLGDVTGAEAARFEDAQWSDANLPHSFSMPYFAADRFYVGYGWY